MSPPLFDVSDLVFAVKDRQLLKSLSLSLSASKITALIGHNGSGKSTLLKILGRQQPATSGTIRFEGRPLTDWGDREFARRLAYLPQQTPAASGMLVRELVALGRYPWHGALGRFGRLDREKVDEAIELTEITSLADRLVDTLSGGERQRAWLAMLLAQDADCLLLDEPTSALDIAHQLDVLSLIRRLSRDRGLSVVVVLHDVNMAARFCDEILALHSGRLIERGSSNDIMNTEALQRIYGVAMDVISRPQAPVALVS